MKALPAKLEVLIETAPGPREGEEWFLDLPSDERSAWTEEWKDGLRRKANLGLQERTLFWKDALQMGALLVVGDLCTTLGTWASALVSLIVGLARGFVCSRMNLERLSTPLLVLPAWLVAQHVTLNGLSVMHFFVAFPLGCAIAFSAVRRGERLFE